jgi:hypothetical protein
VDVSSRVPFAVKYLSDVGSRVDETDDREGAAIDVIIRKTSVNERRKLRRLPFVNFHVCLSFLCSSASLTMLMHSH